MPRKTCRYQARVKKKLLNNFNVFSDGSLRNGKGSHWKVGGFGIWWPKAEGELGQDDLSEEEKNFMRGEASKEGTLLRGGT